MAGSVVPAVQCRGRGLAGCALEAACLGVWGDAVDPRALLRAACFAGHFTNSYEKIIAAPKSLCSIWD